MSDSKKRQRGLTVLHGGVNWPRATHFLRRLRPEVEAVFQRRLTFDDLATLTNEARSTIAGWFEGEGHPSAESILRLQELLPREIRDKIFEDQRLIREMPTLDHHWLAHDPIAISHLRTLARKVKGLTLVRSNLEWCCTFVAMSLAFESKRMSFQKRLCGLSAHAPDWFVPLCGIRHLPNTLDAIVVNAELRSMLVEAEREKVLFVLVDGLKVTGQDAVRLSKLTAHSHIVCSCDMGTACEIKAADMTTVMVTEAHAKRLRLALSGMRQP